MEGGQTVRKFENTFDNTEIINLNRKIDLYKDMSNYSSPIKFTIILL